MPLLSSASTLPVGFTARGCVLVSHVPATVRAQWVFLLRLQKGAFNPQPCSQLLEKCGPASLNDGLFPLKPIVALASLGPGAYLQLCLLKCDCNLLQHAWVLIDNYLLQIWTIYTVYWLTQCKILIQMLMCPWHCIILFHAMVFSLLNESNLQYKEMAFLMDGWFTASNL